MFFNKNYIKEDDEVYCDLLRLARVSDDTNYTKEKLNTAIHTLNQLPMYAKAHWRLIPLLNAKAKQLNIFNKLNNSVQHLLTTETQKGIVREIAKEQQLKEIIEVLSAAKIPMIFLKGTAFANNIYSKEAPRLTNDIDILIQRESWDLAVNLLNKVMVYKSKSSGVLDELTEISFVPKTAIGASLDLHSRISYPFIFDSWEATLWEKSVMHPHFSNEYVRILEPNDAVIHQAIHSFVDMDFCKYNIIDVYETINQSSLDIDTIFKLAKAQSVDIPVYILIMNCQKVIEDLSDFNVLLNFKANTIRFEIALRLSLSDAARKKIVKKMLYRFLQVLSQYVFLRKPLSSFRLQMLFLFTWFKIYINKYI